MRAKRIIKKSIAVTIVCLISAGIYMFYFYTIGIPKTQARSYYLQAQKDLEKGDKVKTIEDLETALANWYEPYIAEELKKLQ